MEQKKYLEKVSLFKKMIHSVYVGKEKEVNYLLIGLFSGLHVLLEDIPGVGKTTLAKTLANAAGLDFGRIQFTPDLLPQDILGMTIWSLEKHDFIFKAGSIMHQFVLADEINRSSARTQSSLLEAMQESHVSIDGNTYPLPHPFFVLATQNPVTFAGTFQLPEAQLDRFGLSFSLGYPSEPDELIILEKFREKNPFDQVKPVLTVNEIIKINQLIHQVSINQKIMKYITAIARETRNNQHIKLGMSPRASQQLLLASQASAFLAGRKFIIPEDILEVCPIVIPHRTILTAEAKMGKETPDMIIKNILTKIPVPTGIYE